jgi:hypothetical protein
MAHFQFASIVREAQMKAAHAIKRPGTKEFNIAWKTY